MADSYVTWLAGLSLVVSILSGMFLFLWAGIAKLRDDMRLDIETMNESIENKAGEHRQAQQQIWSELRLFEQRSTDHRNRMQERIGELPTRHEMKEDLKSMEDRIQAMFRVDIHRV